MTNSRRRSSSATRSSSSTTQNTRTRSGSRPALLDTSKVPPRPQPKPVVVAANPAQIGGAPGGAALPPGGNLPPPPLPPVPKKAGAGMSTTEQIAQTKALARTKRLDQVATARTTLDALLAQVAGDPGRAKADELTSLRNVIASASTLPADPTDAQLKTMTRELSDALVLIRSILDRPEGGLSAESAAKEREDRAAGLVKDIAAQRSNLRSAAKDMIDAGDKDRAEKAIVRLDTIEALAATDVDTAETQLRELKLDLVGLGKADQKAKAEAEARAKAAAAAAAVVRAAELDNPVNIAEWAERARRGDGAAARAAWQDLQRTDDAMDDALDRAKRDALLGELFRQILDIGPGSLDTALADDPGFVAEVLLVDAAWRRRSGLPTRFGGDGPAQLGTHTAAVATAMVRQNWAKATLDPAKVGIDVYTWLQKRIDTATWNDPARGLAARIYNNLWTLGQTDRICELITAGVDSSLPARHGEGEVASDRQGVWSGFVQPLQHMLGHYVRRVTVDRELDKTTNTYVLPDSAEAKVKAAAQILTELGARGDKTPILTKWADIAGSEMVTAFKAKPGTIWGFEDVRLPYVQAARATDDGQQPLRMIELWDAVKGVLEKQGYENLYVNPDKTIADCIAAGVTSIKESIAAAKSDKWDNVREDEFIAEFRVQCTDYLRFLARQTPAAKLATADLNGKDPGKLMGAMACKVGLWWAEKQKRPVYYCLDGIRMNEATSYKAVKNKAINEYWASKDQGAAVDKYGEVITFQEIREILKYWEPTGGRAGLKDTVVFIDKGKVLTGKVLDDRVAKWRADMAESDASAPVRRLAAKDVHKTAIDALDPELFPSLTDREASQVVNKTELLKLAARSPSNVDLLGNFLKDDSEVLYRLGILPEILPAAYSATADIDLLRRPARFLLKQLVEFTVCPALRGPLVESIERRFG